MVVTDADPCYISGSSKPDLDASLLTLYSTRMSPFCQRVRLLLNAKKIPFQLVNISIWEKPEWFLGITPFDKIPAVVEPGHRVVYESLIAAQYLDENHRNGYKQFLPSDPFQKAQELLKLEQIMLLVADPIRNVAMKGDKPSGEQLIKALKAVDAILDGDYFAGKNMGFVDLMVYPWFDRTPAYLKTVGINFADFQEDLAKVTAWRKRMLSDPAISGSSYPDECYIMGIESRKSGKPTPDVGLEIQKSLQQ